MTAAEQREMRSYRAALEAIARGRPDKGTPLVSHFSQNIARQVLIENHREWPKKQIRKGQANAISV